MLFNKHVLEEKELPYKNYIDVNQLKPGDILFGRTDLGDWIIPGYFTHSSIYLGKDENNIPKVIEATFAGVHISDLNVFSKRGPVAVGRVNIDENQANIIIDWAKQQLGKDYDYYLLTKSLDRNAFYCSELIWGAYLQVGINLDSHDEFTWKSGYAVISQEIYDNPIVKKIGKLKSN